MTRFLSGQAHIEFQSPHNLGIIPAFPEWPGDMHEQQTIASNDLGDGGHG
jgi:hypothetical protein